MFKITIPNESAMLTFGAALASHVLPGTKIYLHGGLGAGKTTLTRGFLRGLGFTGLVKSPTYTLVESYEFEKMTVYHFDFYRLKDPLELEHMGIQDYFSSTAICLVEWPEEGGDVIPKPDVNCYLEIANDARNIQIIARSERGEKMIGDLRHVE